jgi:hypothetical protein
VEGACNARMVLQMSKNPAQGRDALNLGQPAAVGAESVGVYDRGADGDERTMDVAPAEGGTILFGLRSI